MTLSQAHPAKTDVFSWSDAFLAESRTAQTAFTDNGVAQFPLYFHRPAPTFVRPLTFLPVLLNHT
jgi:hypothetical protein